MANAPLQTPEKRPVSEMPLIVGDYTIGSIGDKIGDIVLKKKTTRGWWIGFLIAFLGTAWLVTALGYLVMKGIGIWGVNIPVGWAFGITNFVWWIGIGHAGTLISAILLLLKQKWRTSINRFAEAMTLFAVACAGIYPLFHVGRPWLAYWLFPYPNTMALWPQFRSPLMWDVFAVSTYGTVSLLFWYVGLVPDLASIRDRATSRVKKVIYGIFSLGWRGSARHWNRYESAYLLLAGLSTPLVVSVHTIVSFDFAVSVIPGWHTTIFPPYFVDGAIYSGFAMVLTLMIPLRRFYHLEDLITTRHLDIMAKVTLATCIILAYGYIAEAFTGWYSGSEFEIFMLKNRLVGPYAPAYFLLLTCNIIVPQLLWIPKVRVHELGLWILSLVINVGMWLERFIIIVTSLHRDFVPSSWGMYYPSFWDVTTFMGTLMFFLFLIFLFVRFLPAISIFEAKELLREVKGEH